jgi:hypothetical protein
MGAAIMMRRAVQARRCVADVGMEGGRLGRTFLPSGDGAPALARSQLPLPLLSLLSSFERTAAVMSPPHFFPVGRFFPLALFIPFGHFFPFSPVLSLSAGASLFFLLLATGRLSGSRFFRGVKSVGVTLFSFNVVLFLLRVDLVLG